MSDVIHNADASRFELTEDGITAFAAYRLNDDVWTFYHTEVPPAIGGRGIGTALIAGALADVARRGGRVHPTCSFVRAYMDKHPAIAPRA